MNLLVLMLVKNAGGVSAPPEKGGRQLCQVNG